MNKMLFSEGGQPLYIDDLKTLQENPARQMKLLLQALSAGNTVFLFSQMEADLVSADTKLGTTFKTRQNWLVLDGFIYEIKETTLTVRSWDTPLYVGIKRKSMDIRTFENGQEYACREVVEAYLTLEKTDTTYNVYKLKSLFELMAPLIAKKVPINEYKDINVDFSNGYTGQLQYKEEEDFYRVRMVLTSNSTKWTDRQGSVFSLNGKTPKWLNETISESFVTGGDTSARVQMAQIIIKDNTAAFTGEIETEYNNPSNCQISTFFIIPK